MLPRLVRRYVAQSTARTYSSATPAAATSAYPYSSNVVLASSRTEPVTEALRKGKGLMEYLRRTLPTPEKREMIETLFGRRHPKRLLPASVLTVTSTQAPHSFTGILLSIRRRGPDTSFLLRNIVHGTGVELQFFVNSPHLVNIKVEQRAGGQGDKETRRQRRAKVFYLRNAPKKMSGIARRERGACAFFFAKQFCFSKILTLSFTGSSIFQDVYTCSCFSLS